MIICKCNPTAPAKIILNSPSFWGYFVLYPSKWKKSCLYSATSLRSFEYSQFSLGFLTACFSTLTSSQHPSHYEQNCHSLWRDPPGTPILFCSQSIMFTKLLLRADFYWSFEGGMAWWRKIGWRNYNNSYCNTEHKITFNNFRHRYSWLFWAICHNWEFLTACLLPELEVPLFHHPLCFPFFLFSRPFTHLLTLLFKVSLRKADKFSPSLSLSSQTNNQNIQPRYPRYLNQDSHLITMFSWKEPSTSGLNYDIPRGSSRTSTQKGLYGLGLIGKEVRIFFLKLCLPGKQTIFNLIVQRCPSRNRNSTQRGWNEEKLTKRPEGWTS